MSDRESKRATLPHNSSRGSSSSLRRKKNKNAAHRAAYKGNLEALTKLVNEDPEVVHQTDTAGATPLHHACFKGQLACAEFLVSKGSNIDAEDVNKCTPLHNASFTGRKRCVLFCLDNGANVNHPDVDWATPLHKAVFNGRYECAKVLIDRGANVSAVDIEGTTAAHKATYYDNAKCLALLLDHGADASGIDKKGSTTLHKAAFNGNVKCVKLLLRKKVEVNKTDIEGTTPLHRAVYNGHTAVAERLLRAGADANFATKKYESSPLHFAAFNGYWDCIKVLLEHKAQVDKRDAKDMTPLLYAVKRSHEDCVYVLLQGGADKTAKDSKGRTWSDMNDSPEMVEVMEGKRVPAMFGADPEQDDATSETSQNSATGKSLLTLKREYEEQNNRSNTSTPTASPHPSSKAHDRKQTAADAAPRNKHLAGAKSDDLPSSNSRPSSPNPSRSLIMDIDDEEKELQVYARLDRNGFLIDDDQQPNRSKDTIDKEISRAMKWSAMLASWDDKKTIKKVRERCEKGIPARVRGEAWKMLTKSSLADFPERQSIDFRELCNQNTEHTTQINKDINRTFPKNILLMQRGGQEALFNVLKAHAVHHPEVGYCQGMGFVTATLLMYMEEEEAFWVLERICTQYEMSELWKESLPGLKKVFWMLDRLLEIYMPKVLAHLKKQGVSIAMYGTQWFITLFLYNLPFTTVLRIWDVMFYEGFYYMYAVGLSLFAIFEEKLLAMNFDQLFHFLQFNTSTKTGPPIVIDSDFLIRKSTQLKDKVKRSVAKLQEEFYVSHSVSSPSPQTPLKK